MANRYKEITRKEKLRKYQDIRQLFNKVSCSDNKKSTEKSGASLRLKRCREINSKIKAAQFSESYKNKKPRIEKSEGAEVVESTEIEDYETESLENSVDDDDESIDDTVSSRKRNL